MANPSEWGYGPPSVPPKKTHKIRNTFFVVFFLFVGLIVIVAVSASAESDKPSPTPSQGSTEQPKETPAPKEEAPKEEPAPAEPAPTGEKEEPAPAPDRSDAEEFKAFATANGSPEEKAAVDHVVKVQGNSEDSFVPMVEVHTNLTGDMMSSDASTGKLIATAYADWKTSDEGSGLVTVYNATGDIMSNGNF